MLVYRLEDINQIGCYTNGVTTYFDFDPSCDMPCPREEGIFRNFNSAESKSYYCGFKSLEQVQEWFSEENLDFMAKHGTLVSVYKIEKKYIKFGKKQLMFLLNHAILVERMDFSGIVQRIA